MKNSLRASARALLLIVLCALHTNAQAQTFVTNFPDLDTGGDILGVANAATLYVSGSFGNLYRRDGVGRTVNSTSGVQINNWAFGDKVYASIPDGAGGFYAAGEFTWVGPTARSHVARVDASGNVVAAFAPAEISGAVHALCLIGTKLYIGGEFTSVGGSTRNRIARLDATTGALDANFDISVTGVTVSSITPRVLAIDGGTNVIYIGGQFNTVGGVGRYNIAKINLTVPAATDATFMSGVSAGTDSVVRALVQIGSRIYIGGDFTTVKGSNRNRIAKIDTTNGSVIAAWSSNANAGVYDIEVNSANTIVTACGAFTTIGGKNRNRMARMDVSDGTVRTGFVIGGAVNNTIYSITPDGGTNWYCAGPFTTFDGVTRNYFAMVDNSGNVNGTWNPGSGAWTEGRTVAFDAGFTSSGVFIGGRNDATFASGHIGKIVSNAPVFPDMQCGAPPWAKGFAFRNVGGSDLGLAVGPDALFNGGNGSRNQFIEWTIGGNVTAPQFRPTYGTSGKLWNIALYGTNAVVVGDFTSIERFDGSSWGGATARNNIAMVDLSTSPVTITSFDPNANGIIYHIAISGNIVYVAGAFTTIGGQSRAGLAAVDLTDGSVTAWDPNPSPSGSVQAITVTGDGATVFLGGSFTTIGGASRNRLASVNNTDGTANAGFNPNVNGTVYALMLEAHRLYVGGSFSTVGGTTRNKAAVVRFDNGTLDANWDVNCNNLVSDFAIYNNQVVLTGSFTSIMGRVKHGLAAVSLSTMPKTVVANDHKAEASAGAHLHAYPNPTSGKALVDFTTPKDGRVAVRLFTSLGQAVSTVYSGEAKAGMRYTAEIDRADLAPGVYMLQLTGEGIQAVDRLVITR